MKPVLSAIALCLTALVPVTARAWGADGHRLIAEVAQAQLGPGARAKVDQLLALEPGASMASVSTWADEIRSRETGSWHYVNMPPGDCVYSHARDCEDGYCIVEAIQREVVTLQSQASPEERLTALKWIIHLVGDIHQPLHAGLKGDKGGNLLQLQAFGRGTNLHSLWDSGLIRHRVGGLPALQEVISAATVATPQAPAAATWAYESCRVVSSVGFYPDGRLIESDYVDKWDSVLVSRLRAASSRLAAILNSALR